MGNYLILLGTLIITASLSNIICIQTGSEFSFACWMLGGVSFLVYDLVHVILRKKHFIVTQKESNNEEV